MISGLYEEILMEDDYINELTEDEKLTFIKLFCMLVKVDGYIEAEEVEILKVVAQKYGLNDSVIVSIIGEIDNLNLAEVVRGIQSRKYALELIKELCFFANIDENLDEKEVDFIINVAQNLNIEGDKVILINRWVLDKLALDKAGRTILEK